ncbi:putative MFS aflatoxin efflux pump [Podospora appendiculata]|uniref:MFS aflatoxin efflux pump n=1 Tax=Podospora appendiculata TaxID=314037 RepID=A0AAE0X4N6_9PEZI|nr:putative MFS aflatoxin efflux pump [Podospora appendiculata]
MLFRKKAKDGAAAPNATSDATPAEPAAIAVSAGKPDPEPEPKPEGLERSTTTATEDIVYPSGVRLALLMLSVFSSMFLVALDRLIISTAIPQITDEFHSVTDIGWYGSAYLLTNCAFQLMYGKFYTFFSIKVVFLIAILLFEVGSAVCGAAPSSVAFIVGRAIAGLGSAGIMSGVIVIIVYAVPLHKRPLYQGLFGAVFGVSSVIGPLLGGAFTSHLTWRWCFYINLPFGAAAILLIILILKIPDRDTTKLPLKKKILQLDLLGTSALLPGTICLLLALQWGGFTYPWNNGRIIALLVLAGVLLIAFVGVQIVKPDTATIEAHIIKQRSIAAGVWSTVCIGANMMIFVYFIPLWFQAIKGISAIDSGIRLLPMVLPLVFSSIFTGVSIGRIGYYTPFMIVGNCIMIVGAGLLTTFQVDTDQPKWVGYQVLYGWGLGMTFQAPNLAAQTVLSTKDVPIGSALIFFSQLLGGAIFISVGQNILNSNLLSRLSGLPGFNPEVLSNNGATSLVTQLPESIRATVLYEYNEALRRVYQLGLIMACLAFFGSLAMEWRSVKKPAPKGDAEEGKAEPAKELEVEDKVREIDLEDSGVSDLNTVDEKKPVEVTKATATKDEIEATDASNSKL